MLCHFEAVRLLNVSTHTRRQQKFVHSSRVEPDDNNNRGKTQTCSGDDLECGTITSTAVERYTEKGRYRARAGRENKGNERRGWLWQTESNMKTERKERQRERRKWSHEN